MKILFILATTPAKDSVNINEVEYLKTRRWFVQASELSKNSNEVIFIRYTNKSKRYVVESEGVKIIFCPVDFDFKKSGRGHLAGSEYSISLFNEISEIGPDIIHFYGYTSNNLWYVVFCSKIAKIPIVVEFCGGSTLPRIKSIAKRRFLGFNFWFNRLHLYFFGLVDKFLVFEPLESLYLSHAGIKKSKIINHVSHQHIDTNFFKPIDKKLACKNTGIESENINLLYIGMITPPNSAKSPFRFLPVFKKLLNNYNHLRFILVGDGPHRSKFIDEVTKLGIENNVILSSGWIKDKKKLSMYYNSSDLFIYPEKGLSKLGSSAAVSESMSCGTPVITYSDRNRNYTDSFIYYVKQDDESFYEGVVKIITDKDFHSKLSKNSLRFANENFNLQVRNRKISEVYSKILGKK